MDLRAAGLNRLHVELRGRARSLTDGTRLVLAARVRRAMLAAGLHDMELSLSLSDDRELHELNLRFADEDHATDVLSFAQTEHASSPQKDVLGDIVISVEYAERQAKRGLAAELFHLAVHGLVHLLGFDHRDANEERVMFAYEAKLRGAALARGAVRRVRRPHRRAVRRSTR